MNLQIPSTNICTFSFKISKYSLSIVLVGNPNITLLTNSGLHHRQKYTTRANLLLGLKMSRIKWYAKIFLWGPSALYKLC